MLTEVQISKFQELYLKRFGKEIGREKAVEIGLRLVGMMRTVYRPISAKRICLVNKN